MSWTVVARKEYREVRDARLLRRVIGLFVLACAVGGYVYPVVGSDPITTNGFAGFMTGTVDFLLALIGLLLGYGAVVDERTSGTLALVLSMPHRRLDVVLGKLVGRGLLLAVGVVVGLAIAGALVVYPFGSASVGRYLVYVGLTLLLGVAFTGIGMTISTLTTSKHVATTGAFATFFVFVVVWDSVRAGLELGLDRLGVAGGETPEWLFFVHGAEPTTLYDRLVTAFVEGGSSGPYLGPDAPWYLGEWVALVALVGWAVVPIALGYRRFEVTDL